MWIIDDNSATNFINTTFLEDYNAAKEVRGFINAKEALDTLLSLTKDDYPELILLDLNMPSFSGWDFINAYKTNQGLKNSGIVLVILSTSLNPDDQLRAAEEDAVQKYITKPMDLNEIEDLLEEFFQ